MKTIFGKLACMGLSLAAGLAMAQAPASTPAYPSGSAPVRLVAGAAPGGPVDVIARLLGQELQEAWPGQNILVENRVGASGTIALRNVTAAPKDGHSILITTNTQLVYQVMSKAPGYDMNKDLRAVIKVGITPNILVASNGLGVKSLKDVLELAKVRQLNFGTAGTGSTAHLMFTYLFKGLAKVDIQHIPYPGATPALTAVAGNQLDLAVIAVTPVVPMINSGRAVGIGVTSDKRYSALPNVATITEQGFAGIEDGTWVGLFVAAGTPDAIVNQLNATVQKLLDSSAFRDKLTRVGFVPAGGTSPQFQDSIARDLQKWADYMKTAGISPE